MNQEQQVEVLFKKLDECAVIPDYKHKGDVGMDLTAISVEYDPERDAYIYHTGLAFASDYNYGQFLFARSSNRNTDAYLCNHVGIADSAIYRGEIMLCFKNRTSVEDRAFRMCFLHIDEILKSGQSMEEAVKQCIEDCKKDEKENLRFAPYLAGDRVAQMVFLPYPTVKLKEATELNETERGAGGFGSTGK